MCQRIMLAAARVGEKCGIDASNSDMKEQSVCFVFVELNWCVLILQRPYYVLFFDSELSSCEHCVLCCVCGTADISEHA